MITVRGLRPLTLVVNDRAAPYHLVTYIRDRAAPYPLVTDVLRTSS